MSSICAAEAAPLQSTFRQTRPASYARPVIRNASKEHASATDLLRICKASLPHQAKDSALGIVFHTIAGVEQVGEEAVRAVLRAFEVEHVKLAAGFEDAPHRPQCLPFFFRLEMVE